jgi:acetyl-CoA synthetase
MNPPPTTTHAPRRLRRDIADGSALGDVTTLRDPAVLVELEQMVAAAQAQDD